MSVGNAALTAVLVLSLGAPVLAGWSPEAELGDPVMVPIGALNFSVARAGSTRLVAWSDNRQGNHVRAARLAADGTALEPGGLQLSGEVAQTTFFKPSVAASDATFLVAWRDHSQTGDVMFRRIAADGTVLDPAPVVVADLPTSGDPGVAAAWGGGAFVIAWYEGPTISFAFFDEAGQRISTPDTSFGDSRLRAGPAIGFDGTNFLIGSLVQSTQPYVNWDVGVRRVSPAGAVLDPSDILVAGGSEDANGLRLAPGPSGTLLTWVGSTSADKVLRAARVTAGGVVLDAAPITLSENVMFSSVPSAAWDGQGWTLAFVAGPAGAGEVRVRRLSSSGQLATATLAWPQPAIDPMGSTAVDVDGGEVLVAWQGRGVEGALFTAGSASVPERFPLTTAANQQRVQGVTGGADGYLVVVADDRAVSPQGYPGLFGVRLSPAGLVTNPPVTIASGFVTFLGHVRDGTSDVVAWTERNGLNVEVRVARISAGGVIHPAGGALVAAGTLVPLPKLVPAGDSTALVWGPSGDAAPALQVAVLDPTGNVSPPVDVAATVRLSSLDALAWDGERIVAVARTKATFEKASFLVALRFDLEGMLDDGAGSDIAPSPTGSSGVAAAASSGADTLVAWRITGASPELRVARLDGATVLDPGGVVVDATRRWSSPSLSWDGSRFWIAGQTTELAASTPVLRAAAARIDLTSAPALDELELMGPAGLDAEGAPQVAGNGLGGTIVTYDRVNDAQAFGRSRALFRTNQVVVPEGGACVVDVQCESGSCVDGACCALCGQPDAGDVSEDAGMTTEVDAGTAPADAGPPAEPEPAVASGCGCTALGGAPGLGLLLVLAAARRLKGTRAAAA